MNLALRFAEESDTVSILQFIRDLAEYEKMLDEVIATGDTLRECVSERCRIYETGWTAGPPNIGTD